MGVGVVPAVGVGVGVVPAVGDDEGVGVVPAVGVVPCEGVGVAPVRVGTLVLVLVVGTTVPGPGVKGLPIL